MDPLKGSPAKNTNSTQTTETTTYKVVGVVSTVSVDFVFLAAERFRGSIGCGG